MKIMGFIKSIVFSLALALGVTAAVQANEGGLVWDKAPNKTNDVQPCKMARNCLLTTV